jgi:small subunit ribosomal protein S9
VDDFAYVWGTGRRKSAIARVRLKRGNGQIVINGREVDTYFTEDKDRTAVRSPLKATKTLTKYDILANVKGGGRTGQADAVLLGIARALSKVDDSNAAPLKEHGLLTRDSRIKERKKYGRKKARKSFQFSKR